MRVHGIIVSLLACLLLSTAAQGVVCELPDNGSGTIDLPPNCSDGYAGHMAILSGLPPGSTIEIEASLRNFINVTRTPGGTMGGELQMWDAQLDMAMTGTGMLAGYTRWVTMSVHGRSQSAPRVPYQPVQSFDTEMLQLMGQITGDPDFDLLRVTGGTDFGMSSPGHTTLTLLPSGPWNVDSFFDITYRIDFVGAPGGILAGMSGSTPGTDRFQAGMNTAGAEESGPPSRFALLHSAPNPSGRATTVSFNVPPGGGRVTLEVLSVTGQVVRTLVQGYRDPGRNHVGWDGRDDQGGPVSAGVYFYRMRAHGYENALKMVILR
jgi:hypothetical protein